MIQYFRFYLNFNLHLLGTVQEHAMPFQDNESKDNDVEHTKNNIFAPEVFLLPKHIMEPKMHPVE